MGLWDGADADAERVNTMATSTSLQPTADRSGAAPWRGGPRTALERLSPDRIREASLSFKVNTMSTYDGVAMRHYALLSDPALTTLADLL